jgi:hypothetical protein
MPVTGLPARNITSLQHLALSPRGRVKGDGARAASGQPGAHLNLCEAISGTTSSGLPARNPAPPTLPRAMPRTTSLGLPAHSPAPPTLRRAVSKTTSLRRCGRAACQRQGMADVQPSATSTLRACEMASLTTPTAMNLALGQDKSPITPAMPTCARVSVLHRRRSPPTIYSREAYPLHTLTRPLVV